MYPCPKETGDGLAEGIAMKSLLAIRTKIFLAILLILLVSYSFLVVITIRTVDSSLEGELSRKLAEQVRYAKDQYTNRAEQIQYSLMHPASAPPVRERMVARDSLWLRDAARRWMTILPFVELIVFVDSRGTVIAGGNQYRMDRTFELTPVVERALRERHPIVSTELVTSEFLCSEGLVNYCRGGGAGNTGEVMMQTVVVPVVDTRGATVGAFVAGDILDTDTRIPSQVQEVFGRQVFVAITHKEIIPPDSFGKSGPQAIPARILGGLRQGLPFRGDAEIGGKVFTAAFDPLTNSRGDFVGALIVALSRDDYKGVLQGSLGNIVASAILGLVLSFVTAYWVSLRLTKPVRELADGVRRIEEGELQQRVAVTTSDEIGELAEAFNRMAAAIDERDRTIRTKAHDLENLNLKLTDMNEFLERRVEERTAALQVEMGRLEAILTSMAEGIAVTDRDGRVILFNPAAQQLFEMVPHRVVGQPILDICNQGEFCRLVEHITSMGENRDKATVREVDLDARGKKLKVTLAPLVDGDGHFAGVVMSVRDVTAEEEVDRMKTEFISTVSHELKTPLTSIKGSLQLIVDKSRGFADVEKELLGVCLRNTERLIRLVNDILDIAKIESGKMEFALAPHSPAELVEWSVRELEGFAREHGVTVVNEVSAHLPAIYGDGDRLGQVLTNLIANAVKFSPRGAVVTISAEQSDNFVAVSVMDRGREIQWADRGKLFKRFQQIDSGDRRQHGGTGLGLAICKEIVERHHGRIFYSEGIGGGNVFTFTVPIHEGEP